MSMFEGYHDEYNATARLTMLKALSEQADYRLNDTILQSILETFAINRGRAYLHNQLSWLETEAGAVKLTKAGSVVIAEITETGLDHVERRVVIAGVRKPRPGLV